MDPGDRPAGRSRFCLDTERPRQ